MDITVITKPVYYVEKRPHLSLYAACYRLAKNQLVKELTLGRDERGNLKWHWSLLGYLAYVDHFQPYETEEEAYQDLEPVFNIRKWQSLKRERAKQIFQQYKQQPKAEQSDE